MKSGAISLITEGGGIDTGPFPLEQKKNGNTLRSSLTMREGSQTTFGGMSVRQGQTMKESLAKIKTRRINESGELEVDREVTEKQVKDTEFYAIDDEFVVTESTKDDAARELLGRAIDGSVDQALIDVVEFAQAHPSADMNRVGTDQGDADHISVIGDIKRATDLPDDVRDQPNIMLGFEGLQWNRRSLRGFLTKSGYLAIYEPAEMDIVEYSRFVQEEVLRFATPDRA